MKKLQIEKLIKQGLGSDAIYEIAAGNLGLFGVAFFGHRAKRGEKKKLNRVWSRILKYQNEFK